MIACRLGLKQVEEHRSVVVLKQSGSNKASATRTSIDIPSLGNLLQDRRSFRKDGFLSRLGMAKAARADAYKHLPLRAEDKCAAVVTLRNPVVGDVRGFFPRTHFFGATAPALHYNCFSRILTPLARRVLKIPFAGYSGNSGIMAPLVAVGVGLVSLTELSNLINPYNLSFKMAA